MTPYEIRKLSGLSQVKFAKQLGISKWTVIRAERDMLSPMSQSLYFVLGWMAVNTPGTFKKFMEGCDE